MKRGVEVIGFLLQVIKGRIKSRAISKSNIRNRIAIRKNRNEKGRRGDFIGSNPHS